MKKLTSAFIITVFFSVGTLFPALEAKAQFLPFAGLVNFPLPCLCSATVAVWMTPLYLGGPVAISGPLVYSPYSTIPFGNFMFLVPGVWNVGDYIPGVQACWQFVVVGCVPFPTIGVMTKVGSTRIF